MHHTATTTLATAAEPLTPATEPARSWAEHLVEREAARADLDLKRAALLHLGSSRTADENAILDAAVARSIAAKKRRPTWVEAVEAYEAARVIQAETGRRHDIAERATAGLKKPEVGFPSILTVVHPAITMELDGKRSVMEAYSTYFSTRESIEKSGESAERKAEMHAALEEREREIEALQEADGSAVLIRAEREADDVWQAALATVRSRFDELLAYEPEDLADLAVKADYVGKSEERYGMEDEVLDVLAADAARLCDPEATPPTPGRTGFIRQDWSDAVFQREQAMVAQLAALAEANASPKDEALIEAEEAAFEAEADAIAKVSRAVAPDAAALLRQWEEHLPFRSIKLDTLDDQIADMFDSGDSSNVDLAVLFLNTQRLARLSGADVALYPRGWNRYLALHGAVTSASAFAFPDGCKGTAFALIGEFTRPQVTELFAAAWIDEYLAVGGHVSLIDGKTHFYRPMAPAIPAVDRLLAQMGLSASEPGGDDLLGAAVERQVTATMTAKRLDILVKEVPELKAAA